MIVLIGVSAIGLLLAFGVIPLAIALAAMAVTRYFTGRR